MSHRSFTTARRRNPRHHGAFTLVELLVVIGIIAVLIAVLMPALNSARRQANAVTCASNLRNLGHATIMYINEHKHYPGHAGQRAGVPEFAVWPTRLRAYLNKDHGVFRCPQQDAEFAWEINNTTAPIAVDSDTGFGYNLGESLLLRNSGRFSYGYNDWGAYDLATNPQRGLGGDLWGGNKELKATLVRKPAETILIGDTTPDGNWDFALDPKDPEEAPAPIHRRGANILWCDGHVSRHEQAELVLYDVNDPSVKFPVGSPKWRRIAPQWNNDNRF